MMISYAHNFEDVMLFRALKHLKKGFYIDVGAQHPIVHSVSKTFYEMGWRGINIEPTDSYYEMLQKDRPGDINLKLAASKQAGFLTLYEIPDTGLSTSNAEFAKQHLEAWPHQRIIQVPCRTLDAICEDYQVTEVHFLKIDVEGHEKEVLEGFAFEKIRPWILIVEANLPLSEISSTDKWEYLLAKKKYEFAYYDGLNNFYVAQEHSYLLESFKRPPNCFDEFVLYSFVQARSELLQARFELQIFLEENRKLLKSIEDFHNSTSWKITEPIRIAKKIIKKLSSESFLRDSLKFAHNAVRIVEKQFGKRIEKFQQKTSKQLFVDISILVHHDEKTGIQRVVRSVLTRLLNANITEYKVEPIFRKDGQYYYARNFIHNYLNINNCELNDDLISVGTKDIFLGLDLDPGLDEKAQQFLKHHLQRGMKIYFVIYDLLPVLHPEWFPPEMFPIFMGWFDKVFHLSDGVICISRSVVHEVECWLEQNQPNRLTSLNLGYFHLGSDIINSKPSQGISSQDREQLVQFKNKKIILMVCIVYKRKGHEQVLDAMEALWANGEEKILVMVGKKGWVADEFVARIKHHSESNKRLFWFDNASDELLMELYKLATVFLIASQGEGFGLPIIEAAQHALPIIARDLPVFHEIAGENAFYFSASNGEELAVELLQWFLLYEKGAHPKSQEIPCLTWEQSTNQLMDILFKEQWLVKWEHKDVKKLRERSLLC